VYFIFQVSFTTFAIYSLSDPIHNKLTAQNVFVTIYLFNILQFSLIMIPYTITAIVQVCYSYFCCSRWRVFTGV